MANDTVDETEGRSGESGPRVTPALVVAWCSDPRHSGEVVFVGGSPSVLGRFDPEAAPGGTARAELFRQRPGELAAAPPLELPALSRNQLELRLEGESVVVRNLGRRPMLDGQGRAMSEVQLTHAGSTCEVKGLLVLVRADRPRKLPPLRSLGHPEFEFGDADVHGLVGESPAAWTLREQCAFVAQRAAHVLVLGDSGSGKELVAQAIHAASKRGRRAMVTRNAATIPAGLADAELFGNLANYPNPGMPERRGLVGEADGTTLFLDEIGELPEEIQARLLRVLDDRGEYNRLGEGRARSSDLRLVGATNRPLSSLKHDVAARFRLRLRVPGLDERREDIMLIARALLRRVARVDAEIAERFFDSHDDVVEPRIDSALARALVRHVYRTHVRELDALLWRAIATSHGDALELTPDVEEDLGGLGAGVPTSTRRNPAEITEAEVREALERAGGVQEKAWRDLGLANRYVLKRLLAKMAGSGETP